MANDALIKERAALAFSQWRAAASSRALPEIRFQTLAACRWLLASLLVASGKRRNLRLRRLSPGGAR